jgi:hypothetical protein
MTTEIALDQGWVPEACTLPTAQRPLRLAEFDALFATAVKRVERVGVLRLRLTLTGPVELEDIVRDLTERESRCCSFFAFTVTTHGRGSSSWTSRSRMRTSTSSTLSRPAPPKGQTGDRARGERAAQR